MALLWLPPVCKSLPLLRGAADPASDSMVISAPGSAGLHCLPAGGSRVFEFKNHSQSVLHLFEISSIQDFLFHVAWLYMKKDPWNMETVANWHSPFPFLVSCLLSLRWNLSMFCSREHKWGPMDQAFEAVGSGHLVHSWGSQLFLSTPLLICASKPLCYKKLSSSFHLLKQFGHILEALGP